MNQLLSLDFRIFTFFNGFAGRSRSLDILFALSADYIIFLMIAGLAILVLANRPSRGEAKRNSIIAMQALAAAFIGRALIVSAIRAVFFRARPFVDFVVNKLISQSALEGSMPSGHATVMFALAFSLFYVNKKWGAVYLILAVISSLARVIAGVHYPADIFAGMLVGAFSAIAAKWMFEFWLNRVKK